MQMDHIRLLVLVGAHAEVLDGFPSVLGSTEQQGVGTGRAPQGELVKSDALASGGLDAGTGSGCEAERRDGHLGGSFHTIIVGNGTDNHDDPVGIFGVLRVDLFVGGEARDLGQRHRGTVQLRHEEPAKDDLVEAAVGTTDEEAVQLHEKLDVHIVALGNLFAPDPSALDS